MEVDLVSEKHRELAQVIQRHLYGPDFFKDGGIIDESLAAILAEEEADAQKIYIVLRPENLLPVAAHTNHQRAWEHANYLKGEIAQVDLDPKELGR